MDLDFSLSEAFGFVFEGKEPDFSIKDFGLAGKHDGIESQRYLQPRIYESIGQKLLFEHAYDMVSGLRLEPGMRMFALVSGNFIFGDVIEAMVTELGMEIRDDHPDAQHEPGERGQPPQRGRHVLRA